MIPTATWTAAHSERRDALLSLTERMTTGLAGELRRVSRFQPGDRVRKQTTQWLMTTYKELKSAIRREEAAASVRRCPCGEHRIYAGQARCWYCRTYGSER